eukprot:3129837-Amphidinium_carterae.1
MIWGYSGVPERRAHLLTKRSIDEILPRSSSEQMEGNSAYRVAVNMTLAGAPCSKVSLSTFVRLCTCRALKYKRLSGVGDATYREGDEWKNHWTSLLKEDISNGIKNGAGEVVKSNLRRALCCAM